MIALEESGTYFFCRESKEFIDASDIIKNPEYWHEKCWKKSDKCSLKDV